jgi:hypothetical protein
MPTRYTAHAALIAAATTLACHDASAAHRLNDTGIDYCINANGDFIDCEGTGTTALDCSI